jgi:RimJ/RimL family protein N-acetyltransferase
MTLPFSIPTLTTDRLTLRAPRESDLEALVVFGESDRTLYMGGKHDRIGAWRILLAGIGHWALRGYGFWAIETQDRQFIGRCGVILNDGWPEPELAWHLFDGFEGQGYAFEAAVAARDHAYRVWGMAPLISMIALENHRSIALAERLGAKFEAEKQGRARPYGIWRHPGQGALA